MLQKTPPSRRGANTRAGGFLGWILTWLLCKSTHKIVARGVQDTSSRPVVPSFEIGRAQTLAAHAAAAARTDNLVLWVSPAKNVASHAHATPAATHTLIPVPRQRVQGSGRPGREAQPMRGAARHSYSRRKLWPSPSSSSRSPSPCPWSRPWAWPDPCARSSRRKVRTPPARATRNPAIAASTTTTAMRLASMVVLATSSRRTRSTR